MPLTKDDIPIIKNIVKEVLEEHLQSGTINKDSLTSNYQENDSSILEFHDHDDLTNDLSENKELTSNWLVYNKEKFNLTQQEIEQGTGIKQSRISNLFNTTKHFEMKISLFEYKQLAKFFRQLEQY